MGNVLSLVFQLKSSCKNQKPSNKLIHGDGFHAVPEEVWQNLLWKYLDSQDIQNFCVAYPSMYNVMHSQKQIWLFDQVFPFIMNNIKKEDILNLRLTCKRWRRYVDTSLEKNHISSKAFLYEIGLYGVNCNDLLRREGAIKVLHNNTSRYNLIGRSVKITFGHSVSEEKNLNEFLLAFGHQISHLQLSVKCFTTKIYIDYLCKVFSSCPRLKSIDFIGVWSIGGLRDETVGYPEKFDPFDLFIRLEILWPTSLKEICFEKTQQFNDSMLQNICAAVLKGDYDLIGRLRPCIMLSNNYDNIVKCEFEVTSCSQLVPLMHLKLPLQTLLFSLTFNTPDTNGEFVLMLLFEIIENFKQTLQFLGIQVTQSSLSFNNKGVGHSFLILPKLTTLVLHNVPLQIFSSISKLRSLENLVVNGSFDQSILKQKANLVQLDNTGITSLMLQKMQSPYHEPYFSKLWNIFPKLKNFRFSNEGDWPNIIVRRFRRDIYEKHHLYCKFDICKNRVKNARKRATYSFRY